MFLSGLRGQHAAMVDFYHGHTIFRSHGRRKHAGKQVPVCRRRSKWDLVHQKRHLGMSLQFGNFFEMELDLGDMMTVMWFSAQHPLPSELPECL